MQVRPDNNSGLELRNPERAATLVKRRWIETALPEKSDRQDGIADVSGH